MGHCYIPCLEPKKQTRIPPGMQYIEIVLHGCVLLRGQSGIGAQPPHPSFFPPSYQVCIVNIPLACSWVCTACIQMPTGHFPQCCVTFGVGRVQPSPRPFHSTYFSFLPSACTPLTPQQSQELLRMRRSNLNPVASSSHSLLSVCPHQKRCRRGKWRNNGACVIGSLVAMKLAATRGARRLVCPHMSMVPVVHVWGRKARAGFHNHEATVHIAHCCNEGVMFLPLIYPDYTMERESLLKEPCVPALHLSIRLSLSSYCMVWTAPCLTGLTSI